jgi:hypothetical protein
MLRFEMKWDWPWSSPGICRSVVDDDAVRPPSLLEKRMIFG